MRLVLVVSLAVMVACQPQRTAADGATAIAGARTDSARGIISVVGSEPMTSVVLTQAGAEASLAIEGTAQAQLARLTGLEVMAFGRRTDRRSMTASPSGAVVFEAERFEVRAVDDVAAHDGVVVLEHGRFYLRTASQGRLAADFLPAALRVKIGARVFLVGPLDRAPQSYGVIP